MTTLMKTLMTNSFRENAKCIGYNDKTDAQNDGNVWEISGEKGPFLLYAFQNNMAITTMTTCCHNNMYSDLKLVNYTFLRQGIYF